MLKSRKIVALMLAVVLVISALSCVTFAASSATAVLPEGYLVVNKSWEGMNQFDPFEYVLGGETYLLEYGVTAFKDFEGAAAAELPAGVERTIVLAPGLYSESMTLTSDMNLSGPYFGKNPNNNPNAADYDPSLPEWALKNGRNTDPTKEAVFTGTISIADGCNNVTFDGIAFTGAGMISDASRTNQNIEVRYTFKNLYFDSCTGARFIDVYIDKTTLLNRYVYVDSCRMQNSASVTKPVAYSAEVFEIKNSYLNNLPGGGSNVQFYMYTTPVANSLSVDKIVRNSFINNHFENIGGKNFINFAAREAVNPTISQRPRVILDVINNEFIDVSTTSQIIQDQTSTMNQEATVVGNYFKSTSKAVAALNVYVDTGSGYSHSYIDISKNCFENFSSPLAGSSNCKLVGIGPNHYINSSKSDEAIDYVDGQVYDTTLKYASTDFNLLNSSIGSIKYDATQQTASRTATLYYNPSKFELPLFRFKGEEVTYKVYTDAACTTELNTDFVPANGKNIYVKASEGGYTCTYAVTLSTDAGFKTDLFAYGDAVVTSYNNNTRIFMYPDVSDNGILSMPNGDDVEVAGGATYSVHADAACLTAPITKIAITENHTNAYLKVVAPNGNSTIYTIDIYAAPFEGEIVVDPSTDCAVLKLLVPGGTVEETSDGYVVSVADYVKSIDPVVMVSAKANYNFYLDPSCNYVASTTETVKLNSLNNKFYIQVTAESGAKSEAIPVTVVSKRATATYKDMAKVPGYAVDAVNYLNDNGYGIFGGDQKGNLNPKNNITRYELAKVMVVLAGINIEMAENVQLGQIFDDFYAIQGEAAWAIPYVRAAYASGLIAGVKDASGKLIFDGKNNTTREQFVTVFVRSIAAANGTTVDALYKANKADADAAYAGKYADEKKVGKWALAAVKIATLNEYIAGDGKNFNPKSSIIRADVAKIIYNSLI